jgi:hypothetical protein
MFSRQWQFLFLGIGFTLCMQAVAQPSRLAVELHGDQLSVSAPQLHFLAGRAMEKLQNGMTLTCKMTLAVTPRHSVKPVFLVQEKLLVSLDLWEEKYSVAESRPGGRSASRLSSEMVEEWFLEKVRIPVHSIPDGESFVIRYECRIAGNEAEENEEQGTTMTLATLIDLFGHKKHEEPIRWEASSGPMRLNDLKKQ